MKADLFRKSSLERLSSPDRLDQVLRVTSLKTWFALVALGLLLAGALFWGFTGSIVTTAPGEGIIVRSGGVLNVVSRGSGIVLNISAKPGDKIDAGQVIARIEQPGYAGKARAARRALEDASRERERSLQVHNDSARLQLEVIQRQRANLSRQILQQTELTSLLSEQLTVQQGLLAKGLITRQSVLEMKHKLVSTQDEIAGLQAQLKQLDAQEFSVKNQPGQDDSAMRAQIGNLERDLTDAERELQMAGTVISPYRGEVLELKVYPGSMVASAQPILSIQPDQQNLEVLAYLPSLHAKNTKPGMEVQITPSNIRREEFGFMKGEIVSVAAYPSTPAALMRNFENETLVQSLSSLGPITEVRALLIADRNTPSGFKWSTSQGPPLTLSGGTICSVQVVTKRQRPITLLLPYLKHTLGTA